MFLLKENQAFNAFASNDAEKNEVQGVGEKAYIQVSVSAWSSNKNADGSYKKKGDQGYEVPVFAIAFGETAQQISDALKAAAVEAGEGKAVKVAFKTGKGCYVKKTEHTSPGKNTATYHDNYIFGKVKVMDLGSKQEEATEVADKVDSNAEKDQKPASKPKPSM